MEPIADRLLGRILQVVLRQIELRRRRALQANPSSPYQSEEPLVSPTVALQFADKSQPQSRLVVQYAFLRASERPSLERSRLAVETLLSSDESCKVVRIPDGSLEVRLDDDRGRRIILQGS